MSYEWGMEGRITRIRPFERGDFLSGYVRFTLRPVIGGEGLNPFKGVRMSHEKFGEFAT